MASSDIERFPQEVCEKLRFYVYRLIDPRNGETFYVGKGKDNRLFAHIKGDIKCEEDEPDPKLKRIWDVQAAGFEIQPLAEWSRVGRAIFSNKAAKKGSDCA